MDWEANLAAIIKCTDENLRAQFRDHEPPRSSYAPPPSHRVPQEFGAREWRPATPPPRKVDEAPKHHPPTDNSNQYTAEMPFPHHASYQVTHMMEQIRFSIKLEVDARAAIAERQLSAIMALTKSNSDEIDRLRMEASSVDRELRTIDQSHQKLRQDCTTQKDIMYHVQSMCGKDESWRMQADNQLLELRQLVAALREQANSIQVAMQEKLSRPELLVHFNACVEPIKAQLNASLQHQGSLIGDMTRTATSTSYLVDSLVKRVKDVDNRLDDLKNETEAHVHRLEKHQQAMPTSAPDKTQVLDVPFSESWTAPIAAIAETHARKAATTSSEALQLELTQREAKWMTQVQTLVHDQTRQLQSSWSQDAEARARRSQDAVVAVESQTKQAIDTVERHVRQQLAKVDQSVGQVQTQVETTFCIKQTEWMTQLEAEKRDRKRALDDVTNELAQTKQWTQTQLESAQRALQTHQNDAADASIKLKTSLQASHDALQSTVSAKLLEISSHVNMAQSQWRQAHEAMTAAHAEALKGLSAKMDTVPAQLVALDTTVKTTESRLQQAESRTTTALENAKTSILELQSDVVKLKATDTKPPPQVYPPPPTYPMWPSYPPMYGFPPDAAQSMSAMAYHPMMLASLMQGGFPPTPAKPATEMPTMPPPTPVAAVPKAVSPMGEQPQGKDLPTGSVHVSETRVASVPPTEPVPVAQPVYAFAPTPVCKPDAASETRPEKLTVGTMDPRRTLPPPETSSAPSQTSVPATPASVATSAPLPHVPAAARLPPVPAAASTPPQAATSTPLPAAVSTPPPAVVTAPTPSTVPVSTPVAKPTPAATPAAVPTPTTAQTPSTAPVPTVPAKSAPLPGPAIPKEMTPEATQPSTDPPAVKSVAATTTSSVPIASEPSAPMPPPKVPPAPSTAPPRATPSVESPPVLPSKPSTPAPKLSGPQTTSVETSDNGAPAMQGALAEAELAKARVEQRLKLERERRHSLGSMPPPTSPPTSSPPTAAPTPTRVETTQVTNNVKCKQCHLEMAAAALSSHEQTQCPMRLEGRAKDDGDCTLTKCKHCLNDVRASDVAEHELTCDQMMKQCPHCLRRQKMSELQDHINVCDCRLVQCPNQCGGKFLQRGLEKHVLTKCPKRAVAKPEAPKPIAAEKPVTTVDKQECKYCDESFPTKELDDHEQSCDWKPKRCQYCNMVIIARDLARHETSCKQSARQCAHCQQSFPSTAFATHMPKCPKRPIKCIRCGELFPADVIVVHSTSCKPSLTAAAPVVPPPPSTPPPTLATSPKRKSESNLRQLMQPDPNAELQRRMSTMQLQSAPEEDGSDRLSRRSFALAQLTAQGAAQPATTERVEDEDEDDESDDDDAEDEDEDEDDDDDVSLAQVVAEWNVENVCLWLKEDVGVPDVVDRFDALQIDGQALLDLTEASLISEIGIKVKAHRDRILAAIEAIKTSDDYSSDEDDGESHDEDDDASAEADAPYHVTSSKANSLTRRMSLQSAPPPSAQTQANLLNRINSALNSGSVFRSTSALPSK
ncbi:hypothetical protein SDRG_02964 [Saprolegnia diclina VS20]|uniref:SAM domain-containing protein n=1 Tax=Saprolegnia diclina (strain VS20) TaxID=1156394 RepID=T0QXY8_SAPDV|nr:hypothetical protein SDRG_02964 [Saprolegnia diclina VS20]EQC39526.1 hypothetical protein SDRG_02964 [Saprolegnia diclina VS20]|eukprot:XP_008606798.1 hypothetical protein SDRG_02964 [Saprolegnia diclina VS20]